MLHFGPSVICLHSISRVKVCAYMMGEVCFSGTCPSYLLLYTLNPAAFMLLRVSLAPNLR